jgi:hypothetical protein
MDWIPWAGTAPRAVLSAKVQIGLRPVQRCKRGRHRQVPGLGPRVSGSGAREQLQARGEIQILNLHPNLKTRTRLPGAETRDLKTIASHVCTFAQELRSGLHRAFSPRQSSCLRFPFERVPRLSCLHVNLSTCQLVLPTCHLVNVSPRGSAALTFALLHAAPPQLHLCTASSPPPCPRVTLPACPLAALTPRNAFTTPAS